ncbi:MAG: hypothetical protein GIX02_07535 [Candidatus Eremiobacteraeota bacterium]|nr:hypothetical protein [Candidatus Eremiobacteraeota bacterium]
MPFTTGIYPDGFSGERVIKQHFNPKPRAGCTTVEIKLADGEQKPYLVLDEASLVYTVEHQTAVELYSWTPVRQDPYHAAFGRIVLTPCGKASQSTVRAACKAVRKTLNDGHDHDCAIVLGGVHDAYLWIPLADAPAYPELRAFLHAVAARAHDENPDMLTVAPKSERGDRVYIDVRTNTVAEFSALPYTLHGFEGLPVVAPILWQEIDAFKNGDVNAANILSRIAQAGDVFAQELERIGQQRLPASPRTFKPQFGGPLLAAQEPYILNATVQILGDGKPLSAADILQLGRAQELFPATLTEKGLYAALLGYIARARERGRKPLIVQNDELDHRDRRFRINHPLDDYPDLPPPGVLNRPNSKAETDGKSGAPAVDKQTSSDASANDLIDRLHATSRGDDPTAFELAVCEVFGSLGFLSTHLGGYAAPDGYIDAPLGQRAYRAMLECKSSKTGFVQGVEAAAEAASYRATYGAKYCLLVGPQFQSFGDLDKELQTHGVALMTTDDLEQVLRNNLDPYEIESLLTPGRANDKLSDLLWERYHGRPKRVAAIAAILIEEGWRIQVLSSKQNATQGVAASETPDAPLLDEDSAMMLVDGWLSTNGYSQGCTRADMRAASDWLTHPLVAKAVRVDAGIIIRNPRG